MFVVFAQHSRLGILTVMAAIVGACARPGNPETAKSAAGTEAKLAAMRGNGGPEQRTAVELADAAGGDLGAGSAGEAAARAAAVEAP